MQRNSDLPASTQLPPEFDLPLGLKAAEAKAYADVPSGAYDVTVVEAIDGQLPSENEVDTKIERLRAGEEAAQDDRGDLLRPKLLAGRGLEPRGRIAHRTLHENWTVSSGATAADGWLRRRRLATAPTRAASPEKKTTDGVIRWPSELGRISGRPDRSTTATAEYVVPRFIPIINFTAHPRMVNPSGRASRKVPHRHYPHWVKSNSAILTWRIIGEYPAMLQPGRSGTGEYFE